MGRAQQRDAASNQKFYFRKDVHIKGSAASSVCSSGSSTPLDGVPRVKTKKMMNCFPPIPLPVNGVHHDSPVEEEYEEMSMNEIMNGKVRRLFMR